MPHGRQPRALAGWLARQTPSRALPALRPPAPADARLRSSGLERGQALEHDIKYLSSTYGLEVPTAAAGGPGHQYAQ